MLKLLLLLIKCVPQEYIIYCLNAEIVCVCAPAVSAVLYGERLGLLLDYIDPEAQHFIDCITVMFKTTCPMLYIPPSMLRRLGAKVWKDHVEAWDGIFNQGRRFS